MDIYNPKFIISPDDKALHMLTDQNDARVSLNVFEGSMDQQWFVYGDADSHVAIMSRRNKMWIMPNWHDSSQDDGIKASIIPFWWRITKDVGGHKLVIPNTDTALSLEIVSTIRPLTEAKRLYISQPEALKRAQFTLLLLMVHHTPEKVQTHYALRGVQKFLSSEGVKYLSKDLSDRQTSSPSAFNFQSGSDPLCKSAGKSSNNIPDLLPNKSRQGISVFGTSRPKKLIYGHSTQGLVPTASPGVAEIIGFGSEGVTVWLQNRQESLLVSNGFGYDGAKWRNDKHVRLLADTTGRHRNDIVGFHDDGVWVSLNNGDNTFHEPKKVSADFSYNKGWRVEKHLRFMADIRNIGVADIVGFGNKGVYVSLNNGDGTFRTSQLILENFGWDHGWKGDHGPRFLADTTGNGLLDVVGFGQHGTEISRNKGNGTFQDSGEAAQIFLQDFSTNYGWDNDKHPRFLADLIGGGLPDILGFRDDGVYVVFNCGDGTFKGGVMLIEDEFCYDKGWRVDQHPRFEMGQGDLNRAGSETCMGCLGRTEG